MLDVGHLIHELREKVRTCLDYIARGISIGAYLSGHKAWLVGVMSIVEM